VDASSLATDAHESFAVLGVLIADRRHCQMHLAARNRSTPRDSIRARSGAEKRSAMRLAKVIWRIKAGAILFIAVLAIGITARLQ